MSVVLLGSTSGSITLQEPAVAGTNTVNFGANTGVAILDANTPAFRNRIINGAMVIDQRNAGASVTNSAGTTYTVDRWAAYGSQASKFTVQQNAGSVTPPAGYTNYLGVTSSSAYALTGNDYFSVAQQIEANNVSDFGLGAAGAVTFTLSFWVRSSLTGSFGGSFQNSAESRCYSFAYKINAANTWEYKTVTATGDTSGTWLTGTNTGLWVWFGLGATGIRVGTANAWGTQAVSGLQPSSTTSVVSTSGATFYITGVQLEKGSTATAFDYRPYGTELALCQRYYYKLTGGSNTRHAISGNGSLSQGFPTVFLKVSMRTTPTFSYSALSDFVVEGITGGGQATTTGLSLNAGTTETITINCTSAGSGTGTGINLLGSGSGSWTAYSAEL